MTRIKRPAAAVGAAALLAFSLTACGGGGSDAPDDASTGDFCDAVSKAFTQTDSDTPSEDEFDDFKDAVDELGDTGTPDDIPDDARAGFETFIDAVDDLDYDDVKEGAEDEDFGISDDDEKDFEAFYTYAASKCAEELGVPTDIPTDIPTDLTEIPSDLTDIPTDLSDLTEIPTDLSDLTESPTS